MRHAFPLLLPLTSAFNTDFSPRTGARAQRQAAIYLFGNENEHTVESVGHEARFLDPFFSANGAAFTSWTLPAMRCNDHRFRADMRLRKLVLAAEYRRVAHNPRI